MSNEAEVPHLGKRGERKIWDVRYPSMRETAQSGPYLRVISVATLFRDAIITNDRFCGYYLLSSLTLLGRKIHLPQNHI